jgi:hypothetical protein
MTKKGDLLICSICAAPIDIEALSGWAGGHNAQPVNSGRCCTNCNMMVVLPARLARLRQLPEPPAVNE